jgi:predicted ATPase
MYACQCTRPHGPPSRVVLTGGPGAGKTAVLELVRLAFCKHVRILPEAAGVVFGGGFPRSRDPVRLRAAQRAIYHIQHELEATTDGEDLALVLCDRGTIDGLAFWPGPDNYWDALKTDAQREFSRYDAVVHLRTPRADGGYDQSNPLRIETAEEARAVDARIAEVWSEHPHYETVEADDDFLLKAVRVIERVRAMVPPCCPSSASTLAGNGPR